MKRRQLLGTAAAGTVAAVAGGAAAQTAAPPAAQTPAPAVVTGAPQVRWRMATVVPKSLDTMYGTAERISKRISDATNGRFQIAVHGPGELVPPNQALDAVQAGSVESAFTSGFLNFGKDPTFAFDTCIPFGMNSRHMSAWMLAGGGLQLIREFHREYGLLGFPAGNTGTQMAGWFRKEIKGPDDLKGLKMRIGGFGGVIVSKIGVVPQNIPGADVYPALERGTLDAAEWVGPYDDEKLGFNKVAKYYYYPGFWEGSTQLNAYVNQKTWEALPKDYQAIFEAATAEGLADMQARYDAQNPAALKRLVAGGTQLRAFPRPVLQAAWKAANEVYDDLSQKNPRWKKVYDSYVKFRDEEVLWFRVAEGSFDSFMASVLLK